MFTLTHTDQMTVNLGVAPISNQLVYTGAFYDTTNNDGLVNEGNSLGITTGSTPVVVFAAPPLNTFRHIRGFCINNIDTAAATVIITIGGNTFTTTLDVGDFLQFNEKGNGFIVLDSGGHIKKTGGGGGGGGTPWNTNPTPEVYGGAGSPGVSTDYSRGDHRHALPILPLVWSSLRG
jgi:hypothetical protein